MLNNKQLVIFIVFVLLLSGFIGYNIINRNPPMPVVKTENNNIVPVRQGSYCWNGLFNGKCVDMVEPFMLKDIKTVPVTPGEKISITFNQTPLTTMSTVSTWKEGESAPQNAPMFSETIFKAPLEKGIYAVSTDNEWRRGTASHLFFIDVR